MQELANNYSSILNVESQECLELLSELQKRSLNALREKAQFQTDGLATVRVKVSGPQPSEFTIQLRLTELTENLKQKIALKMELRPEK